MTVYHIVEVNPDSVTRRVVEDAIYAEQYRREYMNKGYTAHEYGGINPKVYMVVYVHPYFMEMNFMELKK